MRDNFLDTNNPRYLHDNFFSDDRWRHVARTFKCYVCCKVWAQEVYPGKIPICPYCNDEETA